MKRMTAFLLCFSLLLCLASGCAAAPVPAQSRTLRVVATIVPICDWVRRIAGEDSERVEVILLLDGGADLHSYQPTVEDIVTLSTCDLFLCVGGESDEWTEDALAEAAHDGLRTLRLLDALGDAALEEELVPGMEHEHENEDEDEHEDEHEHEHEEGELDEHVWLSLKNAAALCGAIARAMAEADPEGAADYLDNAAAYIEALNELDGEYRAAVEAAPVRTLLFGDRFPFRYLTEDYGLDYFAAFSGCSAETEASFETIIFLAEKADELDLPAILQIETADGSIARTIRDNTAAGDQELLTLHSMQSAVPDGASYLSLMRENLEVLRRALQARPGRDAEEGGLAG